MFNRQKYFRNELYCFFARKDKKSTIIQYTSLSKNYITYFISSLVLYCYIYIADQTNNVVVSAIFIVPGKISQIRFFSLIFSAKHPNRKVKWCEKNVGVIISTKTRTLLCVAFCLNIVTSHGYNHLIRLVAP